MFFLAWKSERTGKWRVAQPSMQDSFERCGQGFEARLAPFTGVSKIKREGGSRFPDGGTGGGGGKDEPMQEQGAGGGGREKEGGGGGARRDGGGGGEGRVKDQPMQKQQAGRSRWE